MPILTIKSPSQPVPKTEKRSIESVLYTLDCTEILDKHELIQAAKVLLPETGVTITELRPRKGTSIELRVSEGPSTVAAAAYVDYTVTISFTTTKNNTKVAVFQLRVI